MQKNGEIIRANMTPYSTGHSYMHVPDDKVMVHGYKYYIMNINRGMKDFGVYIPEQFSTDDDDI